MAERRCRRVSALETGMQGTDTIFPAAERRSPPLDRCQIILLGDRGTSV